jgi:hypothetical protein
VKSQPEETTRAIWAFLAVYIVYPWLFCRLTGIPDNAGFILLLLTPFMAIAVVFFLLLYQAGWVRWWTILASSALIGLMPDLFLWIFSPAPLKNVFPFFALQGISCGLLFVVAYYIPDGVKKLRKIRPRTTPHD